MYFIQTPNRKPAMDMTKYKETSHLITELSCDPDVQKVKVNSTLNKRYIRDDGKVGRLVDGEITQLLKSRTQKKSGQNLGKAFIICNQHEDAKYGKDRKKALKNAKTVLKEYLNFEVSFCNNCFAKLVTYCSARSKLHQ